MKTNHLAEGHCRPCEKGMAPLAPERAQELLRELDGWTIAGNRLEKEWRLKNFAAALKRVNDVGALAESENHHPDLTIHSYRFVKVALWTHAANGLTENDFILAAKIDGVDGR